MLHFPLRFLLNDDTLQDQQMPSSMIGGCFRVWGVSGFEV
jgi:hypothetical protein